MTDSPLTHSLARRVLIRASRDIVFSYFTDPARWEAWWGAGSTIDARPGGRMSIVYPNGITASGQVVEVVAPERIVFTYGYESGQPIAPGASRVASRSTCSRSRPWCSSRRDCSRRSSALTSARRAF